MRGTAGRPGQTQGLARAASRGKGWGLVSAFPIVYTCKHLRSTKRSETLVFLPPCLVVFFYLSLLAFHLLSPPPPTPRFA